MPVIHVTFEHATAMTSSIGAVLQVVSKKHPEILFGGGREAYR